MNNKGLTIIEFLVYFAILVVVLTITLQLAAVMLRVQAKQRSVTEVTSNIRFAENRFTQAVHDPDVQRIAIDAGTGRLELTDAANTTVYYYIRRNSVTDSEGTYGRLELCYTASACSLSQYDVLTNSKVDITSLTFTKYTNTNAEDSVRMAISAKYRNASAGNLRYYELNSQVTAGLRI